MRLYPVKSIFLLLWGIFAITFSAQAQVTIGSDIPPDSNALLDLKENISGTSSKGIILPRVALTSTTSPSPMAAFANGMVVYNTATDGTSPNNVTPGCYYSDGNKWIPMGSGVNDWYAAGGTTDALGDKISPIYRFGKVGIGTISPDASAILDISGVTNKGILGPKVALISTTDVTTITNPATGLLVYNTGAGTLKYNGYVFWDGSSWRTLSGTSLETGTIGSITCNSVVLTPSIYTSGTYFEGIMNVPYTNGNGGIYEAQTIGPINGLTAKLSAGNFSNGAGILSYTITGTPTVTTPNVTVFPISIGGQTCNATIGAGDGIAPGDLVYYKADDIPANIGGGGASATTANYWLSYYATNLPVIGGKLRLDGYFTAPASAGAGTVSFNPRLVNISSSNVKFWFAALTNVDRANGANIVLAPNGFVNLDNGIYSNLGYNDYITGSGRTSQTGITSDNQEVLTMDINLDDKWYRVYYFINVDNKDTSSTSDDVRRLYLSIQRLY